jgi:predicted amidohydrolase YtcJ
MRFPSHCRLIDEGELSLRIYAMVDCPPMNGYCREEVPRLENYANGFLTVRSVKLFADGALGSWGAAMIDDYSDKPGNRGSMILEYNQLEHLVRQVLPTFILLI